MTGVYTIPDFGPSDLLTSAKEGERRVKTNDDNIAAAMLQVLSNECVRVVNITRIEAAVANGQYYSDYLARTITGATSEYFYELYAPADADIFIDTIAPTADFALAGTGTLSYKTELFLDESNLSSWTYSGGSAPSPLGRNMSGYHINDLSGVTVSAGGAASITGRNDFVVAFINYQLEAQGSSRNITSSEAQFFDHGRTIRIKAGTKLLFKTSTTGTITGSSNIQTYIDFLVTPVGQSL